MVQFFNLSSFPGDGMVGYVVSIAVNDISVFEITSSPEISTSVMASRTNWGDRELYVNDSDGNSIRFQAIHSAA
jgi:hypothetical protein